MTSRLLSFCLLLFLTLGASAASRISVDISVTNNPATGNTLTINSAVRTWTNTTTSATIATNSSGTINAAATNLFDALSQYPFSGPLTLGWVRSNTIRLTAEIGNALVPAQAGNWAELLLDTNTAPGLKAAQWPFSSIIYATNRTNQASAFIDGLSDYGATSFGTNCIALSNYVSRGAIEQTVYGTKRWLGTNFFGRAYLTNVIILGGTITGTPGTLTDGYFTNSIFDRAFLTNATLTGGTLAGSFTGGYLTNSYLDKPVITNATLYGGTLSGTLIGGHWTNGTAYGLSVTNLRASGEGVSSLAIGGGAEIAEADGELATAVGPAAIASAPNATAVGYFANATGTNSTATGTASQASATASSAYGQLASASAPGSVAIGHSSEVSATHTNSVAIGKDSETTKTNQLMLGTSTHIVTVPGVLEAGATTNSYLRGTNVLEGSLAIRRFDHSSLVNGDNASMILGTNTYIRITAGPSAAFTIHGFSGGQDGQNYKVVNYTGQQMTLANNSGTEPTAGNRILTGTGGNVVVTNYPGAVEIIYDSSAAKWTILGRTD